MALQRYKEKRRFSKTPEPKPNVSKEQTEHLPIFVVQRHHARRLHYDFRIELDGVLISWAIPKGPSQNPSDKRLAVMTEDHPLSYADFEGNIPRGEYGAGEVIVWDRGVYTNADTTDREDIRRAIKHGLHVGEIKLILLGEKLKGRFVLVRLEKADKNSWLFIKERDEFVSKKDITRDTRSVLSSEPRSKKRRQDPMPHNIRPMLAKLADKPFDKRNWFFEVKWDGYRAIAEVDDDKVSLYSRNSLSFADTYKPVTEALRSIKHQCVLDGEIIALKNRKPDFHTLQQYKEAPAVLQYCVFDLLYLDGEDLRKKPLLERKQLLRKILPKNDQIIYSEHAEETGEAFFETLRKEGFEGMIAKDAHSPYRTGKRSDEWLKIKSFKQQEAIIVGFTKPRGSRKLIGALVLAAYENGDLRYIGHSGGGFTDNELRDLHKKLSNLVVKKAPISEKIPINSPITWVKPKLVCEAKFSEWTPEGRMRHPIYAGLRIDKDSREVIKEMPSEASPVDLKNRDKVFWPDEGYTKGDVAAYYEKIADTILPYLKDRPENLNRHPNGITGENFYHKDVSTLNLPEYAESAKVWSESNNKNIRYLVCNNKKTLLYLANLGCIEINPWNSRVQNLERPDYMILDLDPNGRPFDDLITVAQETGDVLDRACERYFVKTSGKTGLHIVIPLGARHPYEDVKNFAHLLMQIVHGRLPEITSLERSPLRRQGKIYLDYLQNRRGQTLSCAYSLRPYPGATVSTPLEWGEVKKGLDPRKFNIKTIWKRLKQKGDLWKGVLDKGVDLSDAIRCLQEYVFSEE